MKSQMTFLAVMMSILFAACGQESSENEPGDNGPIVGDTFQSQCLGDFDARGCDPMDATLEDFNCDTFWGYKWNGEDCEYLGGACQCIGDDCQSLYASEQACREGSVGCFEPEPEAASIDVEVNQDTVTVTDQHAVFNCCLDAWMEVDIDGNHIQILEKEDPDTSNACDCMCPYELSIQISQLEDGEYTLSVYRYTVNPSTLVHEETFLVDALDSDLDDSSATRPIVGSSEQSACMNETNSEPTAEANLEESSIEILVASDTMVIMDHALQGNCCLEYQMQVDIDGNNITVFEQEMPGDACNCMCVYEVSVEIAGLKSGVYHVNVYGFRQSSDTPIHSETVEIF